MTRTTRWTSIDAYIAAAPASRQAVLDHLRAVIRAAAPEAEETISYNMPAFAQNGTLVYFALHPLLALAGGGSLAWIQQAARTLADAAPRGRYGVLEGQTHEVAAVALAPALLEFFTAR